MKRPVLILTLLANTMSFAQSAPVSPEVKPLRFVAQTTKLTLKQYIEEVKAKNPGAQMLQQNVSSLENRLHEARLAISPELFADWTEADSKAQPPSPFAAPRTNAQSWNVGIRQQTTLGLRGELKLSSNQVLLDGINAQYTDMIDSNTSSLSLSLELPLLRNAFGNGTRAQLRIGEKGMEAELEMARHNLNDYLIGAENAYWTVSSLQQVIGLQTENVENASRMSGLMRRKAGQNLVDDVEALQAQAGLETRRLELQQTTESLRIAIRAFNQFRFVQEIDTDPAAISLEPFPERKWAQLISPYEKQNMTRPLYRAQKLQGEVLRERGALGVASLYPDVSLVGAYGINGREPSFGDSFDEAQEGDNNNWAVGVKMSVPLNLGLLGKATEGYRLQRQAGENMVKQNADAERRNWQSTISRLRDSVATYERARILEDLSTKIVSRERRRLQNGRTTTFQLITAEQNLATAQIARVRSQLGLIQMYNDIQTYEAVR